jgi:polysaccharide pyruvyl transferase WcaK-like protein
MKRVLVAGAFYAKNLGDYGMLLALCESLKKRFNDIEIIHLSRHIDPEFDDYFGIKSIKNLDHDTKALSEGRWFNGLNYGDDTTHLINMRKAFENADLLMIGAGPMLSDITLDVFRGYLPYNALLCVLAKVFSVPVMLYGVEIIPLATEEGAKLVKFICDNSDAICVREGRSKEILTNIGVPPNRVEVFPDPSMSLSLRGDVARGKQLLQKYNVNTQKPLVGVVARHLYWIWDENDTNNYINMIAKLCDWIIEKFDVHVVFFPHCTYGVDNILEDDRETERVIQSKMQNKDSASLVEKELTLSEAFDIYATLEMLIASRHHAVAYSILNNVPPVGLYDSPALDQTIGGFMEFMGLADHALYLREFDLDKAKDVIARSWDNRQKIKETMSKRLPSQHKEALRYFDIASQLISNRSR